MAYRVLLSLTGLLIVLSGPATGQRTTDPPFRLPPGVEVKSDLVYAAPGGRELRLDLFLPKTREGQVPAVVYVHGGGWRGGNKEHFHRQAAHMASIGFAGACIEYRLSGEAKYPAAIQDVKAAVRWLRANAERYRIDPGKIGSAGGSAGGHLAALLGTTAGVSELEGDGGNAGFSSRVQAVAAFNPALDLEHFVKEDSRRGATGSIRNFLGYSYAEKPQLWAQASPILHVSKDSAAFLFLHGTKDETTPYEKSVEMMKRLQASGVRAELFTAEGAGHGFFNRPPWFEPTLKRMEQFFLSTLK